MTRFIYIADSHLGADPMGYQMQPGYPDRLPEVVAALADWISDDGRTDFILHGGDLVDTSSDASIRHAAELFDLPIPMHLCLGNHDTTEPGAAARWLALAPQLFGAPPGTAATSPTYTVDAGDCLIHIAPNHWCETDHYWQEALDPQLRPVQVEHILS
ncbi:MAG: metallophosphoesterase family protein, partial [Planctomycetota bacterium]